MSCPNIIALAIAMAEAHDQAERGPASDRSCPLREAALVPGARGRSGPPLEGAGRLIDSRQRSLLSVLALTGLATLFLVLLTSY
jgi:hypothetical protein